MGSDVSNPEPREFTHEEKAQLLCTPETYERTMVKPYYRHLIKDQVRITMFFPLFPLFQFNFFIFYYLFFIVFCILFHFLYFHTMFVLGLFGSISLHGYEC